jgi:hypothetical protein
MEDWIRNTPDRQGRRRTLGDVYVDFVLHYLLYKDFEPLASHVNVGLLGKRGAILLGQASATRNVGWNIPYGEGRERKFSQTFKTGLSGYRIIRTYNISSMTSEKHHEQGPLDVSVDDPNARLLVIPYRNGPEGPLVADAGHRVSIPQWEKKGGALVYVIGSSASSSSARVKVGMRTKAQEDDLGARLVAPEKVTVGNPLRPGGEDFRRGRNHPRGVADARWGCTGTERQGDAVPIRRRLCHLASLRRGAIPGAAVDPIDNGSTSRRLRPRASPGSGG